MHIESHENFVTGKGKVGITKSMNLSLPFLHYFGEKIKSGGPYSFLISLLYFSAFQTREKYYLFPLSLFSLSLFLISLQPNRVLETIFLG